MTRRTTKNCTSPSMRWSTPLSRPQPSRTKMTPSPSLTLTKFPSTVTSEEATLNRVIITTHSNTRYIDDHLCWALETSAEKIWCSRSLMKNFVLVALILIIAAPAGVRVFLVEEPEQVRRGSGQEDEEAPEELESQEERHHQEPLQDQEQAFQVRLLSVCLTISAHYDANDLFLVPAWQEPLMQIRHHRYKPSLRNPFFGSRVHAHFGRERRCSKDAHPRTHARTHRHDFPINHRHLITVLIALVLYITRTKYLQARAQFLCVCAAYVPGAFVAD